MNNDIRSFVEKCDKCQRASPKFMKSAVQLHPIPVKSQVWHQVSQSIWCIDYNYKLIMN